MTWKNSRRLKKTKLKFTDQTSINNMASDLKTLSDLEVLDYKITGPTDFSVSFSKKFVEYYNINKDRLQHRSVNNMVRAIGDNPKTQPPDIEDFTTMFYSTVFLTYLQEDGKYHMLNMDNIQQLGNLIYTIEVLHNLMIEADIVIDNDDNKANKK